MMEIIIANQELFIGAASFMLALIIRVIWKKSVDKAALSAILLAILDIIQDIAANPETSSLANEVKKSTAVQRVEAILTDKKRNLVQKVFGTIGNAVEYVYKNRKWMLGAAARLLKVVF